MAHRQLFTVPPGDLWASLWASVGKEPACNVEDARGIGSIPGLGRSPGEGHSNHSSILAWRIPWTEEPGELQTMELQRVGHD